VSALIKAARVPVTVATLALAVVVAIIMISGYDVTDAIGAAVQGAVGTPFAIFSATLKRSIPLMLLGISVTVAFRAGVLNIGGEGQFLVGAAAGVAAGLAMPPGAPAFVVIAIEVLAGVVAGAAWAAIAAWLHRRYGVFDVVSTLLLNFVALNLIGFLIRGPMQEPPGTNPQSSLLPEAGLLPQLIPGQRLHAGFLFALIVVGAAWWFFRRTASGFRLTLIGASPTAATVAGLVNVPRERFRALVLSGAIAGLAGVSEAAGVTYRLYEGLSPGYGYLAIAVALLGRLSAPGVAVAAILFGGLGASADAMQRNAGVPPELAAVVAAIVVLGMLAAPRAAAPVTR
jgi:ABC-type uncharacterized transport system permease subunit